MYVCMYARVYVWRSEDDSVQRMLAFHVYTNSWDQGHQAFTHSDTSLALRLYITIPFIKDLKVLWVCVCVSVYICHCGEHICGGPEEDAGSPGAAFTGSCEPSEMRAGTEFTSFVRTVRHLARPRNLHFTLRSVIE